MHLYTILAFAFLFWRADQQASFLLLGPDDVWITLAMTLLQPVLLAAVAALSCRRARRLLARHPLNPQIAQYAHHRVNFVLKVLIVAGFAGTVFLTRWPDWFNFRGISPWLQIVGDLIVLSPFFIAVILVWLAAYPLERDLRVQSFSSSTAHPDSWRLGAYLNFQLRHHVLIVAVPMIAILMAFNVISAYESSLQAWTKSPWAGDVALGTVAMGVFVFAPVMLRRIWSTKSLPPGPVREKLEATCRRIGMKCRDILVWKTDGMMINAAVMGLFPSVRYVLLSDGLLETMSPRQVEAVFGHEAGHVRHKHIQHFLIFALVGWLLAAGVMEGVFRVSGERYAMGAQTAGVVFTLFYWLIGFGWVSRRFERQADLFGAACVSPDGAECELPCSVHLEANRVSHESTRVCATGAAVFASALDQVALLNGIPHDEPSWRHSSIGKRIRFLSAVSDDPALARRFEQLIRRIKTVLVVAAVLGSAISLYFVTYEESALVGLR